MRTAVRMMGAWLYVAYVRTCLRAISWVLRGPRGRAYRASVAAEWVMRHAVTTEPDTRARGWHEVALVEAHIARNMAERAARAERPDDAARLADAAIAHARASLHASALAQGGAALAPGGNA